MLTLASLERSRKAVAADRGSTDSTNTGAHIINSEALTVETKTHSLVTGNWWAEMKAYFGSRGYKRVYQRLVMC